MSHLKHGEAETILAPVGLRFFFCNISSKLSFQILVDDLLIYNGILQPSSSPASKQAVDCQSVSFSDAGDAINSKSNR